MFSPYVSDLLGALDMSQGDPITILIDGPSGAGKTAFAKELESAWPTNRLVTVLHLDDFYPGWDGLDSASAYVRDSIMLARIAGQSARWQSWDWATNSPGKWNEIPASCDVVIEGCGAITYQSARVASASVWVDADDDTRKLRALSRGGEDFDRHWDSWDAQFTDFVLRENPQAHASFVVGRNR